MVLVVVVVSLFAPPGLIAILMAAAAAAAVDAMSWCVCALAWRCVDGCGGHTAGRLYSNFSLVYSSPNSAAGVLCGWHIVVVAAAAAAGVCV